MDSHWKLWVTDVTVEPRNEAYDNIAKIPKKNSRSDQGIAPSPPPQYATVCSLVTLKSVRDRRKNRQTAVGNAAS